MSLVVAINGTYHSYFNPEYIGRLNPHKSFSPKTKLKNEKKDPYSKVLKQEDRPRVNIFAKDIMRSPVYTVLKSDSIDKAMLKMQELRVHHLLVGEDKFIVGIISDRDLLRYYNRDDFSKKKVEDVMTNKVLLCQENSEVRLISKIMLEESISCIPVIDDEKKLTGIITRSNLLECIVNNMPLDVWI